MTKPRSHAKQRIVDAAFEHFVVNGYEGASLSAIADSVGIRKASIYTHFSSKDALFLQLLEDAVTVECTDVTPFFVSKSDDLLPGEAYLLAFKSRYDHAITARFLTRMAYVPPVHLYEKVTSSYTQYIESVNNLLQAQLHDLNLDAEHLELFSDAYLGILDSLSVELLYAGNLYQRRLTAMLSLYRHSLKPYTSN